MSILFNFDIQINTISNFYFKDTIELEEGVTREITSPNYPGNYHYNSFKLWEIRAPKGHIVSALFQHFKLTPDNAFLRLGDGVDKFSTDSNSCSPWKSFTGNHTYSGRTEFSKTSSLKVIFTSDHVIGFSGFSLKLRAVASQNQFTNKTGKWWKDDIIMENIFIFYLFV